MSVPKPTGKYVDQILGSFWESSITPESLSQWSATLAKAGAQMELRSLDGLVGSEKLLGYGTGVLAETISASWAQYFTKVGVQASQVLAAGGLVGEAAATLGAMLASMSVVDRLSGWRPRGGHSSLSLSM